MLNLVRDEENFISQYNTFNRNDMNNRDKGRENITNNNRIGPPPIVIPMDNNANNYNNQLPIDKASLESKLNYLDSNNYHDIKIRKSIASLYAEKEIINKKFQEMESKF